MVQQCNPGSTAYLHLLEPTTTFQRFFLSFEAQKKGFMEGCRPFIGIDGCHLKGPYGGGETLESWSWFLEQLRLYLKYPACKPICFMSDRQKGLIGALKAHWPHASIKTPYSGQKLKQLFWKASKSYDVHEFKKAMRDIGLVSMKAQAWLCEIETENWCRHAFDPSIKCDHVTNNMTEAFNSMLKDFRARTYLNLLEFIRRMVMTRFQVRKEGCGKWKSEIPPTINKKIVENSVESRVLQLIHAGEGKYELMGVNRAYTANLQEKTCECGAWQINGVPCNHALAGIRHFYGMSGINEGITHLFTQACPSLPFLQATAV
ncbi:hypothetical protein Q3G72_004156 [Acer saccharum]|nr:hypothetical protein Q3G72_004156 [Acer saccharum]